MTDTDTEVRKKKATLSLAREPRRLELRQSVESGQIKQSFSHGRTKTVQVEVRRKRTVARTGREGEPEQAPPEGVQPQDLEQATEQAETAKSRSEEREERQRVRHVLPTLNEAEKAARARALKHAQAADAEARRRTEDENRRRLEQELERERESAEADRRRSEEEARQRAEEESLRKKQTAQPEAPAAVEAPAETAKPAEKKPATPVQVGSRAARQPLEEETARPRRPGRPRPGAGRRGDERRQSGKLTITEALDAEEAQERMRSLASVRRERERQKQLRQELKESGEAAKVVRDVVVPETITVQELANRMAERSTDVIRRLMSMGVMATINQAIDADTAELVVEEFGHRVRRVSDADVEIGLRGEPDIEGAQEARPPVVTVMGHVDHGKTSLLDAIRSTDVVAGEAGGITQHIGAYQVETAAGNRITFIDTPGHEAFTAMRSRGASVTDIVVLVVAADDGVMPQTIEAINHAKAAEVPIIVAINKIDKPDADPSRVKQELLQHEIVTEEFGGEVQAVEVSATQRLNLDKLEEAITLQAEFLELKANPNRSAEGVVVESRLERGRGTVVTALVQRGNLRVGDILVAGTEWGKVRALLDSHGRNVESAGPAMPVEVLGLNAAPQAGDEFAVVESEGRAREVTAYRQRQQRDKRMAVDGRGTLDAMFEQIKAGESKEFAIVVKGDVQGSVEAIVNAMERLDTEEVVVRILHAGVGAISESDVTLARASDAVILGFNVRANAHARDLARRDGVDIRYYAIIYELVDDMKRAISGLLAPEVRETVIGGAEILEVFSITKVGKVAGCRVTSGVVRRNTKIRLLRDNVVIHDGALKTLKRYKEEVREVREGMECGIAFESYQDLQPGDTLEVYEVQEVERSL